MGVFIYALTVYGMSQVNGVAAIVPLKDSPQGGASVPQGSSGVPVPGYEIKVPSKVLQNIKKTANQQLTTE